MAKVEWRTGDWTGGQGMRNQGLAEWKVERMTSIYVKTAKN